jgi:NMD protein affecting ribosome stability and mRNA decay
LHVRKFRLEEILRTLVSHRAPSNLHGDLVSVHQKVIPRPQQIRQLELGIRGATRRRDGRRFTFARRTSGDLVAKVYPVHRVTTAVADSSPAHSIDVDTLRMMTHYTLPQKMITQTMCVLSFASVEHH